MDKMSGNALKRARISRKMTQEGAAEAAGCSVDAIQRWEDGSRRASVEVLDTLAIVYETPWLPQLYLRELSSGPLSETLPEFRPGVPLPQAVVSLLDKVLCFTERHGDRRLIAMAADGKIDAAERQEYDAIMEDLRQICQAAMEVKYSQHGGP